MRALSGATEPSGHGVKKFDGGRESNRGTKHAFRLRSQDASDNDAGHVSPEVKPSARGTRKGGDRQPRPHA